MVSGCQHATIGEIVRGLFALQGENHGRPTFKKNVQVNDLDVILYFWDERDGPAFCGWWFGPKIGGDQVWAFHPAKEKVPPVTGWRVPFNGPNDPTMVVKVSTTPSLKSGSGATSSSGSTSATTPPRFPTQPTKVPVQVSPPKASAQASPMAIQPRVAQGSRAVQPFNAASPQAPPPVQQRANSGTTPQPVAAQSRFVMAPKLASFSAASAAQGAGQEHRQGSNSTGKGQGNSSVNSSGNSSGNGGGWQGQGSWQSSTSWQSGGREEDAKRKQQEEARKRVEENKRRMEESNRAEQQKKLEEERQKRETQERKAKELKSANEIRKVQQKVRAATADTFEEVRQELEVVLEAELNNTVEDKRQQVLEDSEKILEQAQKRVNAVLQQRRRAEEQKREEMRQRMESEQRAEQLRNELCGLVESAEAGLARARAGARALADEPELLAARVEALASSAEGAAAGAAAQAARCSEFFRQHRTEMLATPRPQEEEAARPPSDDPFDRQPLEPKKLLGQLLQRLNSCKREAEAAMAQVAEARGSAEARALALARTQELHALFRKYDKDADEMLSRKEVQAYAKGEFDLELPDNTLNFIWDSHAEYSAKHGDRGIFAGSFQLVKVAIGIEREMRRDRQRHAEKQVMQQELEEKKAVLQDSIERAIELVSEADAALIKVEENVKLGKSKSLLVSEMFVLADQIAEQMEVAKSSVIAAKEGMDRLKNDTENRFKDELLGFLEGETRKHESKLGRMDGRMKRGANALAQFREDASRKRAENVEKVRAAALRLVRYRQQQKHLTSEDVFREVDVDGDGSIDKEDFVAFFERADKVIRALKPDGPASTSSTDSTDSTEATEALPVETVQLPPADLAEAFPGLCADGETSLSHERFKSVLELYMLVVKESAMTDGPNIKDSKVLRRLELDEVVRVTWGPTRERDAGVLRMRVRAMRDGVEGWVTTVGNAGTVFLREGGRCFTTLEEAPVTKAFDVAQDETEPLFSLKPGDTVDVEEWPRRQTASGPWRMRVRLRADGTSGWVTSVDSQGTVFLKAVTPGEL